MEPSPQSALPAVNVEEIMREIRERVRRKRGESALPMPGSGPGLAPAGFTVPNADRVSAAWSAIGGMPPVPRTLRGRAGALAVGLLRRLLSWYTAPIALSGEALQVTLNEYSGALERLAAMAHGGQSEIAAGVHALAARVHALAAAQEDQQQRLAETERKAADSERTWQAALEDARRQYREAVQQQAEQAAAACAQAAAIHGQFACQLSDVRTELATVQRQLRDAEREILRLQAGLAAQDRRLAVVLQEARKRLPEPFDARQLQTLADEDRARLEALYCSFEDAFRGSREDIRERLRRYLPYVRQAVAGRAEPAVLDLGCGRGEWIELLKDEGIPARGVDTNAIATAGCIQRGLNVLTGDGLSHLAGLPDASLDAITAFHVIEHLPWEAFIALLDDAVRVLRSGGCLILETPNPENILVGANNFYFDPTHRKPMPAGMTRFMVEARGLCRVEALFLHPYPEASQVEGDSEVCRRFNQFFYGPQDYAVIGHKV